MGDGISHGRSFRRFVEQLERDPAMKAAIVEARSHFEREASTLRPCLVLMLADGFENGKPDLRFHLLAPDYEHAVAMLDVLCIENGYTRRSAEFHWDDEAIKRGWKAP